MLVGTDGNMWSCSDGLSLGDSRSKWVFERTLGEAVEKYRALYEPHAALRKDLYEFWNNTPEEFREANEPAKGRAESASFGATGCASNGDTEK